MQETYQQVGLVTGRGSFRDMKTIMEEGVKAASCTMYDAAAKHIDGKLTVLQVCPCWRLVAFGLKTDLFVLLLDLKSCRINQT